MGERELVPGRAGGERGAGSPGTPLPAHPAASPASQKCHLKPPCLSFVSAAVLRAVPGHHRGDTLKGSSGASSAQWDAKADVWHGVWHGTQGRA